MNIAVIGTGYVGLVTGACLAESGNNVICVDIDEEKIRSLEKAKVPFYEPGLEDIVKKNLSEKRLCFTTDIKKAVENSLIIFIAVGTPPGKDGSADTSAVLNVAKSIGENLNSYKIVATKSTVPVGTTEMIQNEIKSTTDVAFDVASNPEFLKEGAAVEDFMKPDRVIIGVESKEAGQTLKELYAPFMRSSERALIISIRSSELAKYTANAMLATRISFMNEIANLCEIVGADVSDVRHAVGADERIGHHFLFPGIGYGGSCFPKDVKALISTAKNLDYELKICAATDKVNNRQRELFWNKIERFHSGSLRGKKFGVWGLSFKPKTDDIREAPAIFIVEKLIAEGANIIVHDPAATKNTRAHFGNSISYAKSNYGACEGADALIINTEWNEYRQPDFSRMKNIMEKLVIFDGRNLYDPQKLANMGFKYIGVGIRN